VKGASSVAVKFGFYAALEASTTSRVGDMVIKFYRSGMLPRPVWQEFTTVRIDGKPYDSPMGFTQYQAMLNWLKSVNARHSAPAPLIEVEEIPEWVLQAIALAEQRDAAYYHESHRDDGTPSDQSLRYTSDLESKLGDEGRRRVQSILPYQHEGAAFGLLRGGRCMIADEMGLGKTLQALIVAYQYHETDWPLLVICPSSIRFVWREQITKWLGGLIDPKVHVQVITKGKDVVHRSAKIVIVPYILLEPNPHLSKRAGDSLPYNCVICDESHYIKDPGSKRSKAVVGILKKAKRAILLSGTPSMNNAEEMYPQMVHLLPVKAPTLTEFRNRYCEKSEFMAKGRFPIIRWSGAKFREELNAVLTKAVMIRRRKADVLTQLPSKMRFRVDLDVSDSVWAGQVKNMTSAWLAKQNGKPVPAGSTDWGIETMELWRTTGQAKLHAMKEYIHELIRTSESSESNPKFILFAHHKFVLDGLEELLVGALPAGGYVRIDGSVSQSDQRAKRVKQFQEDPICRVALLSITSCSEGITMTAASTVIFCEMYWVPGVLEQAEARAHRVGQKDCVMCYYLLMADSPDEVVFNMLEIKKKNTSVILDGVEEGLDMAGIAELLDDDAMWVEVPGSVTPEPKRFRTDESR
jgi:SWI/SNF-related matrix-associated actin-dependent regulator of chromatin subfamily A-like protein 1